MIEFFPWINAGLNALATILLAAGWCWIRARRVTAHQVCMLAACAVSAAFLGCYLVYHYQVGSRPFPGNGVWKIIYRCVLFPHIILAAVMLPMIAMTLWHAIHGQLTAHRRLARWTLPIWLYVSLSGVVVFVMLYLIPWK